MSSTQETGHAKNVANLQDLIAFVTGYGATYNPSKTSLKLTSLIALNTIANTVIDDVVAKNTGYNNAVNARLTSFNGLKALSTRIVNAISSTDATPEKIKDVKGFNRKMQGKRATTPQAPVDPNTPAPNTISAVQLSFDNQVQHFAGIISILQSETSYAPNEADLKIATLTAKQADLKAKNSAVATAYTSISNTRIARDKTLYKEDTGLVAITADVKKYVKSIYGASSPEFAQVSALQFKNVKK
jgi:hypothetical protein